MTKFTLPNDRLLHKIKILLRGGQTVSSILIAVVGWIFGREFGDGGSGKTTIPDGFSDAR